MSGPTTVAPSAVRQVMHTLTSVGPRDALARTVSANANSAGSRSAFSRSITGSHHGRQATSFVGSRRWLIAIRLAPVRCTPPRRRLQSTVRDGRSPGSRVVAISRLPGECPSGIGLGLVAYSCGGSAGVERTRTGFPFHLPRGRTIGGDAIRRGGWGQPVPAAGPSQLQAQSAQAEDDACRLNTNLNHTLQRSQLTALSK